MKEQLYRMIFRSPQARERWEALRREGAPRWRALAALPLGAREEGRPLPAQESESARSHREPPRALARRLAPFDVVSFDVFDTLLLRDVDRPEEVFSFVGAKLGYPDFRRLRVEAERRAREKKRRAPGAGEVTLREIWQELERMTALPVLILILLVLVAYWISLPLLVVGLFFGCKYRFSGPDLDKNRVGEVVNQVSAKVGDAVGQVRDEFKREFDKSRGKKGK